MDEVFYDEELDRQYDCEHCRDTGRLDGSDYYDCAHCSVAQERVKLEERMTKMKRSMPANDAMWSLVKSERKRVLAVRAAELALLKSKLLQAERELAEVRKDAQSDDAKNDAKRLSFVMMDIDGFVGVEWDKYDYAMHFARENGREEPNEWDELTAIRMLIDAVSVAQANKEQGNG